MPEILLEAGLCWIVQFHQISILANLFLLSTSIRRRKILANLMNVYELSYAKSMQKTQVFHSFASKLWDLLVWLLRPPRHSFSTILRGLCVLIFVIFYNVLSVFIVLSSMHIYTYSIQYWILLFFTVVTVFYSIMRFCACLCFGIKNRKIVYYFE